MGGDPLDSPEHGRELSIFNIRGMGCVAIGSHSLNNKLICNKELFKEPEYYEKYKDTNKTCIYLQEVHNNMSHRNHCIINEATIIKSLITMEHTQDNVNHWQLSSTEEFIQSKHGENSHTGMNKQQSRKTRGAIEKYCIISSYSIAKAIVIYCEILSDCSYFGSSAGGPESASEQYIFISPVIIDTLIIEILTFSKVEEFHNLFVYWYFVIMILKRYINYLIDFIKYIHYFYIYGCFYNTNYEGCSSPHL